MIMKRVIGLGVVAVAIGLWGGVSAWHSATVMVQFQVGLAIFIGCVFLFCLWLWYQARPGSGDAMVAPWLALVNAAMLAGVLPRLLWPAARGLHLAGSITSILVLATLLVMQIRRRSIRRRDARPT